MRPGAITVADWLTLPPTVDGSRLELIYGHLHVTPASSGEHQRAGFRLARLLDDAVHAAGRTDLHVVPAISVRISTAWRTALIPDVAVLTVPPVGASFAAEALALVVEIWSRGNPQAERETKKAAYAAAGVPFFWTVTQDHLRGAAVIAHRLVDGQYEVEYTGMPGETTRIAASPVPVTVDPADLTR